MAVLIQARHGHEDVLAALHAEAFPPEERWDAASMAELLAMPGVYGLIADEDGFIIARVAADEAEVITLAVLPHSRRRGIARQLLDAAIRIGAEAGADHMILEVAEPNAAARALYGAILRRRIGCIGAQALPAARGGRSPTRTASVNRRGHVWVVTHALCIAAHENRS